MRRVVPSFAGQRLLLRIFLHGALLLTLTASAFFFVGPHLMRRPFEHGTKPLVVWAAARMCAHVEDPARLKKDSEGLPDLFTFYGHDGRMLFSNVSPPLPPLDDKQLENFAHGSSFPVKGQSRVFAVSCRQDEGEVTRYVVASMPPMPSPKGRLALALGVIVLIALVGSVPLTRQVALPIERLVAATKAFGRGDLGARTDVKRFDEIGDLARAFNEMASRIESLIRAERELLANISHELRTPMARIRVVLEMAEDGDAESAQRYLPEIRKDLAELETLVEGILATAKLEFNAANVGSLDLPVRAAPVAIADIVAAAADRFRSIHGDTRLAMGDADACPTVRVDAALVRRALDNLLDNAQKYSDQKPIELGVSRREGAVEIRVKDYGIGIAEHDLPKLFTPFFRTDASRTRKTGGVGLGLALAKRIVVAHGGDIRVESRVGVGTTFTVSLPV